jgi:hypothetical protein
MSTDDLTAGMRWVERKFEEIVREFGVARALAREDRWRGIDPACGKPSHRMTYYVELHGHLKRGEVVFGELDLEIAGTGERAAREKLGLQIRDMLTSSSERRE